MLFTSVPNSIREAEEEARKYGLDTSLVDANLSLTFEERLRQHQEALNLIVALTSAGTQLEYARFEPPP